MARIRKGSGVREQDLIARAKSLRESIDPLIPRLTPDCPSDRFDRRRGDLEEVRAVRDDERRLEKMSRWGDPMARSLAGLLKFYLEPSPPTVVAFPVPGGEVSFAALARTDKEAEVAVQQSDDPERLLLGYIEWARKGFHFFATRRALWCTGRSATPPDDFRTEKIAELPYRLTSGPGRRELLCVHLAANEPRPYLEVGWPGAGTALRVCRKCAKDDRHLLSSVSDGSAGPDPSAEFPVGAALNVRCNGGPTCVHADLPDPSRQLLKRYELGRVADAQLIAEYESEIRPRIERVARPTFVAGGVCFGDRRDEFLEALHPSVVERRALVAVLDSLDGYFEVDEPSASRALERLWADHAETIVGSIVRDPEEARRVIESTRGSPGRVAEVLKRAQRQSDEREVLGALPRYRSLAQEAAWLDRVARDHRTHGDSGAEKTVLQTLPREGKERGIAYGVLLALGRANSHAWQFTDTEREFGAALADRARELLAAPAAGYHAALDRLLAAAGVANWGEPEPARASE